MAPPWRPARRVYLIEEPLAAALGNLDIAGPGGHMVVDIGGGTHGRGGAVYERSGCVLSTKVARDAMDEAIMRYVRRKHGVVLGKIRPGSKSPLVVSIPGRKMPVVCWSRGTHRPSQGTTPPGRGRFWRL